MGNNDVLEVSAFPNPTSILARLGLTKLKKRLDKFFLFPSSARLYAAKVARLLGERIAADIRAGRSVVLVTCLPPHDLSILGINLKKRFPSIRWCADWQDLWSYDENYLERVPALYRDRLRKVESRALQRCDLNVTTNRRAREVLIQEYAVPQARVVAIPHHVPASAGHTASGTDAERDGAVRLAFVGTLCKPPRVPGERLLETLSEVRERYPKSVELHLYGSLPDKVSRNIGLLTRSGLVVHKPLPQDRLLAELADYDFLIVLLGDLPNSRVVMSIKLAEYLVAGPSIIAIVPRDSFVADVVRETGSGQVVNVEGDWAQGLLDTLGAERRQGNVNERNEAINRRYSWRTVAGLWRDALLPDA